LRNFGELLEIQIPDSVSNLKLPDPALMNYYNDKQHRTFWLDYEIGGGVSFELIKEILEINRADLGLEYDERKPIKIMINSGGGCCIEGSSIVDAITNSKTPIYTINMGMCYSMAGIVFMCGHQRYMMPSSSVLIHSGSLFVHNDTTKVIDYMEFNSAINNRIDELIVKSTFLTKEQLESKKTKEWYILAKECSDLGICDGVIGEDISLEELI